MKVMYLGKVYVLKFLGTYTSQIENEEGLLTVSTELLEIINAK